MSENLPSKHPGGAPPKLDKKSIEVIKNLITMGTPFKLCAQVIGVNPKTITRWLQKGEENPESLYGELYRAVRNALAMSFVRDLQKLDDLAHGVPKQFLMKEDGTPQLDGSGKPIVLREEIPADKQALIYKMEKLYFSQWVNGSRGVDQLADNFFGDDLSDLDEREVDAQLVEEERVYAVDDPDSGG